MENNEDKYIEEIRDMLKEKVGYKNLQNQGSLKRDNQGIPLAERKKLFQNHSTMHLYYMLTK